jgi:hypothetical protein
MKGLFLKILLVISDALFLGAIGYVYFVNAALDLNTLFSFYAPVLALPGLYLGFVLNVISTISTFNFTALLNLAILGGSVLGFIFGFIALIVGFKKRRPILGLTAFVSVVALFLFGVSLAIPNVENVNGVAFYRLVLNNSANSNSELIDLILLVAPVGFGLLSLFIVFLMVIFAKKRGVSQPKIAKVNANKPAKVADVTSSTSHLVAATPIVTAPAVAPVNEDNLSELVKMVMQEELNAMRSTQNSYAGGNNHAHNNAVDVNVIRRIVTEEVAKIQTVSRSEVQSLIAQEITLLKSKLKIK